jgi:putative DNA primase/helicase
MVTHTAEVNDLISTDKRPSPDIHIRTIRAFIERLTGSPNTPMCWRFISDSKANRARDRAWEKANNKTLLRRFEGTADEMLDKIEQHQAVGCGVFVVVNEGGHSTEEITEVRALFVDADDVPLPREFHVEPDFLTVRDQTHWHAYWLVKDCTLDQFEGVQRRLAERYGTDNVHDLPRVMRVPGTIHLKDPLNPALVELVPKRDASWEGIRTLSDLTTGLPDIPAIPISSPTLNDKPHPRGYVEKCLSYLDPGMGYGEWRDIVAALRATNLIGEEGNETLREIARDWSAGKYWKDGEPPNWESDEAVDAVFDSMPPKLGGVGFGTILYAAREEGFTHTVEAFETMSKLMGTVVNGDIVPVDTEATQLIPVIEGETVIGGSDDDLTTVFTNRHGHELRHVVKWGRWMRFDGQRWIEIETPAVWNMIRPLVRRYAGMVTEKANELRRMNSKQTIASVEALARGAPGIIMPADAWDADPMALNTPAGIIDLRTGDLGRSDPLAYATKMTAVAPSDTTDCPLWRRFLDEVTDHDRELQGFLQRVIGYSLTGQTSEHAMFFLYGTGANGKGVFLNTVSAILADYAKTAPVDTFTESKSDRHPTDMAMLQGAHLVTAQETDQGRAWAEAKIKTLTGGDPITARFMHQDFFTYTPSFKLVIAGNHKPKLHNVDEAIRRRLYLVPFTVTIPAEERDPDLAEKLKAEWPAILRWAIEGCLTWQTIGLAPPKIVTEATEDYFTAQDPLAEWMEACCVRDPQGWASTTDLYTSYTRHVGHNGGINGYSGPEPRRRFVGRLESAGFTPRRFKSDERRGFAGLRLREGVIIPEYPFEGIRV